MNKAFKFRMYPNKEQSVMIAKTCGCARFIYNRMLSDREEHYKETGKSLHNTPAQYKDEFPWLREVDSLALANAWLHLDKAYKNFFSNPKQFRRPVFKSKHASVTSYSTNNQKGTVRIEHGKIKLPKIGFVKIVQHRELPENSTIKTVTVSKSASGKFYVSILVEYEDQVLRVMPQNFLGLDFAMHGLYVASDGLSAEYPMFLRKSLKRLAKAQRKLCRKQKGGKNREKQRRKVAVLHERVRNQRLDFLHKKSHALCERYDLIGIEDLNVKGMAARKKGRKFSFGKSIADNGWGLMVNMLDYKMQWAGKRLVRIDRFYPSTQLCHVCGYKNADTKDLSVREWICPKCGTRHDRDVNAAINIREEARRLASCKTE